MSDEQEFALNGVAYAAMPEEAGEYEYNSCLGCAFKSSGCVIREHPCFKKGRTDNRNIIWKKKLHGEDETI